MKVLLEAHHPAHIHFWKYPVRELIKRGHEVLMIGRDRDVMRRLLEVYDWIPSEIPKRKTGKNTFPLVEMLERQWAIAQAIRRFNPDVVASLMGSYTQTAKLFGVRNVIFTDSEFQHFNHRIAHPFADEIHTPDCFYKNLGPKQQRYHGIHELMFLSARSFDSNADVLRRYGNLEPGGYIVVRMSAWNTLHDVGASGVGDQVRSFIERHRKKYRILISAEENCDLEGLQVEPVVIAAEDFHDVLHYSAFVLTEGASTASEAACLGVPTVYINSTEQRGYLQMLQDEYEVVKRFESGEDGVPYAGEWLDRLSIVDWAARGELRRRIQSDLSDGSEYVVQALLGGADCRIGGDS